MIIYVLFLLELTLSDFVRLNVFFLIIIDEFFNVHSYLNIYICIHQKSVMSLISNPFHTLSVYDFFKQILLI